MLTALCVDKVELRSCRSGFLRESFKNALIKACKLSEIVENQKPFLNAHFFAYRRFFILAPDTSPCTHCHTRCRMGLLGRSLQAHSMLVSEWSCVGIKSVCGVSSLSSLMAVASRASWDTTELSDLQAVLAELFSCTVDTLPGTVARLWKWLFSAKDSNLSESLDDAYSSSGCSVLCPSSFLGEPSTITRKDFHGVFLSWTEVCLRRVDLSVNVLPHALHMNGFSPVWIRWWRWRALSWVNCLPHWSQQ